MHVATIADALKKLPARAASLSGWRETADETGPTRNGAGEEDAASRKTKSMDDLARVVAASAADLEPLQVTNVVSALGWREPLARRRSHGAKVGGARFWPPPEIERLPSRRERIDGGVGAGFLRGARGEKWLEKTSAGLSLSGGTPDTKRATETKPTANDSPRWKRSSGTR